MLVLEQGVNLMVEDRYYPWDLRNTHRLGFKCVYDCHNDSDNSTDNNDSIISPYDLGHEINNKTALQWAIAHKHDRLIRTLLENGANSLCRNQRGRTAISKAVCRNNYMVVELLLGKGADINAPDKLGGHHFTTTHSQ